MPPPPLTPEQLRQKLREKGFSVADDTAPAPPPEEPPAPAPAPAPATLAPPDPVQVAPHPEVVAANQNADANASAAPTIPAPQTTAGDLPQAAAEPELSPGQAYLNSVSPYLTASAGTGTGGSVTKTTQTQQSVDYRLPEEQAAAYNALQNQQQVNIANQAAYLEQKGREQAQAKAAEAEALNKAVDHHAEYEQWRKEATASISERRSRLEKKMESDQAELEKMRSEGIWYGKNALQRVLGTIALGLQGFAHGHSGGRTQQTVLTTLSNEIDGQIADYQKRLAGDREALNALAKEGLSIEEAIIARRNMLWEDATRRVEAIETKLQGTEKNLDAQSLSAQMRAKQAGDLANGMKEEADKITTETVVRHRSGGGGGVNPDKALARQGKALDNAKKMNELYGSQSPNEMEQLRIEDKKLDISRKKQLLNKELNGIKKMEKIYDQAIAFRKQYGYSAIGTKARTEAKGIANAASAQVVFALSGSTFTDQQRKVLGQAFQDLNDIAPSRLWTEDPVITRLQAEKAILLSGKEVLESTMGSDKPSPRDQAKAALDRLKKDK